MSGGRNREAVLQMCHSILKAWFHLCSTPKFTKHGLQDEPAGICGICSQFQELHFPQPGAASRGHSSMYSRVLGREGNHARLCESELGSVLSPDAALLYHCPAWSANACCLLRALSLSFRGSLRGCGSSAEPRSPAAPPCLRAE